MNRPNLFRHATSELSQDAVLCWLLAWADASCATIDPEMHAVGRDFLEMLYTLPGKDVVETAPLDVSVRIFRQKGHTDIVAEIGENDVLVIEERTETSHHDDQLQRYRESLAARFPNRRFVGVYIKTGDEASYEYAARLGWAVCRRGTLLDALRSRNATPGNAILADFVAHLDAIEKAVGAYAHTPIATEWDARAWSGFFVALRERLGDGWWGYVANASGGFMGYWWSPREIDGASVHLQLEQDRLAVNVEFRNSSKSVGEWTRVVSALAGLGMQRPKRTGRGRTATLGAWDGDYRAAREDGTLDFDVTCARISDVAKALEALSAAASAPIVPAEDASSLPEALSPPEALASPQ